jgi:hypothetical protein
MAAKYIINKEIPDIIAKQPDLKFYRCMMPIGVGTKNCMVKEAKGKKVA